MSRIRVTARELLVEQGTAAVTVSAVARRLQVTGPAIYRYYDSHEALIQAVTADFYDELIDVIAAARDAGTDAADRLLRMCRALRAWAVAHPAEYGWIFQHPATAAGMAAESAGAAAGDRFGAVFRAELARLWRNGGFPVRDTAELPQALRRQLEAYSADIVEDLPPQAVHVLLGCWIRLFGTLSLEMSGQLEFAFDDPEPVFEECLAELADRLALEYRPPRSPDQV
ncbi:TetR/AcrR family transcriptional regulator [Stackebrandtia albiflava]|nr:TetR/AcrR family transcriptional regulator [Stackebrandtia albiflava]